MYQARDVLEVTIKSSGVRMPGRVRHTDGKQLLVALDAGTAAVIKPGEQIELVQWHKDGMYTMVTTVVDIRENCFRAPLTRPGVIQRRQQVRVECNLESWYSVRGGTGVTAEGRTVDISAGGAKLYLSQNYKTGVFLDWDIVLSDEERLALTGQILRCVPLEKPYILDSVELTHQASIKFLPLSRMSHLQLQRLLQTFPVKNT